MAEGEKVIFKLQKPIYSNMEMPEVLCYNKDRSITISMPMPQEDVALMFGDDLKQYWDAEVIVANETNNVILQKRVKDQDW